ncbi:MAG: DUF308 domain-containing protein [Clostridia bacterium]|nr:DUF308 domain-containing protein [Clostridia bacterium]
MSEKDSSIRSFFTGGKIWVLTAALVGIVLGILMIANAAGFLAVACYVLGTILALFGLAEIVMVFVRSRSAANVSRIVPGVLSLAVGLAFLFQREELLTIVWFFFGLAILIDSVYKLEHAFAMKAAGVPFWWVSLCTAIASMVLAAVVMMRPMEAGAAMVVLAGAMILVNGLFDLAEFILLIVAGRRMKTVATVIIEDAAATDLEPTDKP